MSDDAVAVDIADGVMTITSEPPQAKNAVNKAMADGISAAIDELESNPDLRGHYYWRRRHLLLRDGSGPLSPVNCLWWRPRIRGPGGIPGQKPVIAAVEGYAWRAALKRPSAAT